MEPTPQTQSSFSGLAIPIAIVFGFALIAGAILFSDFGAGATPTGNVAGQVQENTPPAPATPIRAVDESDFVRGNPNAPILIVEYSDYDCPFCKRFHDTMNQIINEYGPEGRVAWVYRQFPLAQLHPNAPSISEAALCVGELGDDKAFWAFSDQVFNERSINEPTNIVRLPEYAEVAGVSRTEFDACVASGRHRDAVQKSVAEGAAAGITGTPQSFVLVGNQQAPINGAQPYEVVKQIIDNLIAQLDGATPTSTPKTP